MTVPNLLTALRLALVPVFLALVVIDTPFTRVMAVVVLVAASITDFLDGYIARHAHQVSEFGKVADPLADRALIFAGLLGLVIQKRMPLWVLVVLVARDMVMLWGYQYLAAHHKRVPVQWLGKLSTAVLLVAFTCLLLDSQVGGVQIGLPILYAGVALSLIAGAQYIILARREVRAAT